MKRRTIMITAALGCLAGSAAPSFAQQEQPAKDQPVKEQGKQDEHPKPEAKPDQKKGKQDQKKAKAEQPQAQQKAEQPRKGQPERVSQERQQQLVAQQEQRMTQYRQRNDQQQRQAQQHAAQRETAQLQLDKRASQYRYQEAYMERMRQQQMRLADDRQHDYGNDPYFHTAFIYRYSRGGSYYETNEYGAELLRRAVNYGYAEGFRTGEADRQDRWRSDYRSSYAYRDANYGYTGYYVDQDEYNYYFREGFQRGYEDGFNSRYQYGRQENGSYIVLQLTLGTILDLRSIR